MELYRGEVGLEKQTLPQKIYCVRKVGFKSVQYQFITLSAITVTQFQYKLSRGAVFVANFIPPVNGASESVKKLISANIYVTEKGVRP